MDNEVSKPLLSELLVLQRLVASVDPLDEILGRRVEEVLCGDGFGDRLAPPTARFDGHAHRGKYRTITPSQTCDIQSEFCT